MPSEATDLVPVVSAHVAWAALLDTVALGLRPVERLALLGERVRAALG